MLYLLCLVSGVSGALYAVAWARVFGDVFGNTVDSLAIVTVVSLLGLAAGAYLSGPWADRRAANGPSATLKAFGQLELAIAGIAALVSLILPAMGFASALTASYSRTASGWYALSVTSSLARIVLAIILVGPAALLTGAAIVLLVRYAAPRSVSTQSPRIALACGAVILGAALGAYVLDFALVPRVGLRVVELVAVISSIVVGAGALRFASTEPAAPVVDQPAVDTPSVAAPAAAAAVPVTAANRQPRKKGSGRARGGTRSVPSRAPARAAVMPWTPPADALRLTSIAVALAGFAALGLLVVWFRHFTLLLGGFRIVYALLLTVVLASLGIGTLVGSLVVRYSSRPAHWLIATIGLVVIVALTGLVTADVQTVLRATAALAQSPDAGLSQAGTWAEFWIDLRPMLLEVCVPALLIGVGCALASAIVQRDDARLGTHAGTVLAWLAGGAACAVLVTPLLFLPRLGIQSTVTALMTVGVMAMVPLALVARTRGGRAPRAATLTVAATAVAACVAVGLWLVLPANFVIAQATAGQDPTERLLSLQEGAASVVAVTELPDNSRWLLTNGNRLSASNRMSRRSARALAHIPLLLNDQASSILVIGFGVGNTARAAALHPTVRRIDVVDPSSQVFDQASYFKDVNGGVLSDRRVTAYVNDGREHLRMQAKASYDVIAVDPPPLAIAGSGALYSTEFYDLVRSRLKPKGYVSEQLPVYELPSDAVLEMIRAFVDVFPQAVLLGGTGQDLILVGTNDSHIEVDPARLSAAAASVPELQTELQGLDLGTARDIVGTFVGSAQTLSGAARNAVASRDERPMQEYAATSRLTSVHLGGVPAQLVDVGQVATWCPRCSGGDAASGIEGLSAYLALLEPLYKWSLPPAGGAGSPADAQTQRLIRGSTYLGELIAEHTARRNARGAALATDGKLDEAIGEFRNVLRLNPGSAQTHWNLGRALASRGQAQEAIAELREAVTLDPNQSAPHYDLATTLMDVDQLDPAIDEFRAAVRLMPGSVEAHNNLGIALGRRGRLEEAVNEFQQALKLNPEYAEAQHNLSSALQASRNPGRTAR